MTSKHSPFAHGAGGFLHRIHPETLLHTTTDLKREKETQQLCGMQSVKNIDTSALELPEEHIAVQTNEEGENKLRQNKTRTCSKEGGSMTFHRGLPCTSLFSLFEIVLGTSAVEAAAVDLKSSH